MDEKETKSTGDYTTGAGLSAIPMPGEDGKYIDDVFGAGGALATVVPGYKPRPGQIKMARAINGAICKQHHVIVEGPTGTGKSLGYSVPAAFHAINRDVRVCIVTSNKSLQNQIAKKDLPLLQEATGWQFRWAVRKGISSYLCERAFSGDQVWMDLEQDPKLTPDQRKILDETREWAHMTQTGDFEDSPGPPWQIWRGFSTAREECDGKKCSFYDDCFVAKAKAKSDTANIVITNYHLFYTNVKLGGRVLPGFDVVIFDEAHNAANIGRDFFGEELTYGAVYKALSHLNTINELKSAERQANSLKRRAFAAVNEFWNTVNQLARDRKSMLSPGMLPTKPVEDVVGEARAIYEEIANSYGDGPVANKYAKFADQCESVQDRLWVFRTLPSLKNEEKSKRFVYFIDGDGKPRSGRRNDASLKSKALTIGGFMRATVFESYSTVVQTSATLAVQGKSPEDGFNFVRREMGLLDRDDVDQLVVESPFNWKEQALLVIPEDFPPYEFNSDAWDRAVCNAFQSSVEAAGGRTLGLFTSFRMVTMVKEHLRDVARVPYNVMAQGEHTNAELQRRFREDVSSILLGTESFCEGVDIQGEACTVVILDKIPFTNQNDPLLKGLKDAGENVFAHYQIPESIIKFKQRVGRLIRTVNDVGVIVVLDNRILPKSKHAKRYATQFINSIPPIRVSRSLSDIHPFLKEVGAI